MIILLIGRSTSSTIVDQCFAIIYPVLFIIEIMKITEIYGLARCDIDKNFAKVKVKVKRKTAVLI